MSWELASTAILALVLATGFAWYERRKPPARIVALVAALAALAVVGRLAFAAIPNVKPTTDIVLFAGFALGPVPGFAVGAITALVSNIFLGQGPWTAWQMVAWGGVGIAGGGLAKAYGGREIGRVPLAIACGIAGLAFGALLDVYQTTLAARQDLPTYLAVSGTSLPYNLAHAIGNVVFCLVIGPAFIRALRRYRRRFEVRWHPVAAAATVAVALLAAASSQPEPAQAAVSPAAKAARYLERAQNRDGGYGGAKGQRSSKLFTGWSALGLAAARRNPRDVARRGGRTIVQYLATVRAISDVGELERTILVLKAAGISPRRYRGRNLVADLLRRQRPDGSWKANNTFTAFGMFALRAAGVGPGSGSMQRAASYLERGQNADGGFGFVARAESDVDDTGAAMQALSVAGRRQGRATTKAVGYLRTAQNPDGGFGQLVGKPSNAQSTAWAVQGLVAAGIRPDVAATNPIRYLTRLQRRDGHIAYSRTSDQTPVWVTAQALTALRRKPFPLATVPRKRRPARRSAGTTAARARPTKREARAAEAPRAPVRPRRVERFAADPPAVDVKTAAREEDSDEGVPAALVAAAVAGALGLVFLARRRLSG